MTNYSIIRDRSLLEEYIEWLPSLEKDEKYYVCLFSRRKYHPDAPHSGKDKHQLKRFLSDKENLIYKIQQLECPLGSYRNRTKKEPINEESIALYIMPNPRDMRRAQLRSLGSLAKCIENDNTNPHQEVLSTIHKTPSKKRYVIFDLDEEDTSLINSFIDVVDKHCTVIKTRGGYHLCVDLSKVKSIKDKLWYQKIASMSDVIGDTLSPVVGCTQGNFIPYFYFKDYEFRIQ